MKDKKLQPTYYSTDLELDSRDLLYQGFLRLEKIRYRYSQFSGDLSNWVEHEVLVRPPAVVVLPIDIQKKRVVLIEQIRSGVVAMMSEQPWLYETVAGMLESSDSIISGAERELKEETGLEARAWEKIAQYWVSPGGTTEEVYAYCALVDSSHASGIHGLATESEDIRVITLTFDEIFRALEAGEINNSATLLCVQWLQLHKDKIETMWSNH